MTSTLLSRLEHLKRKRELLEQLFTYARQLAKLQGGMETLQQMLKPSQKPGRKSSAILEFCAQLGSHDTAELKRKIASLDVLIARELAVIIKLSELTQDEFLAKFASSDTDELLAIEKRLVNFRRNGQINVAMRYLLHERGVQLEAAKLPISQEKVNARLDALRGEEAHCRSRIRRELQSQIADIQDVLANDKHADELKRQFAQTLDWLNQGLEVLEHGGKLEDLPYFIETVVMESDVPAPVEPKETTRPEQVERLTVSADTEKLAVVKMQRVGFFRRVRIWLNTPANVRWRDTRHWGRK